MIRRLLLRLAGGDRLRSENERLIAENGRLRAESANMRMLIRALRDVNADLDGKLVEGDR